MTTQDEYLFQCSFGKQRKFKIIYNEKYYGSLKRKTAKIIALKAVCFLQKKMEEKKDEIKFEKKLKYKYINISCKLNEYIIKYL